MPLYVSSTMCSSSGGQNCIIQHLVPSHSVDGCPVYRLREDWLACIPTSPLSTCATDGHPQSVMKHLEAFHKLIIKQDFVHQVG